MNTHQRRTLRWPGIVVLAALGLLLLGTVPVAAAERRSGDAVTIAAEDVIPDDLYVAATTITIDGTVKGDVLAVGATITINGTIEGDLMAMGQTVTVNGTVRDDARITGAAIVFGPNARLGDDLMGGAAQIDQQAGSAIDGDVYLGASQARLAGTIGGDVRGGFQGLEVRGAVGGALDVSVGGAGDPMPQIAFNGMTALAVPSGLTVADSARIDGTVTYESPTAATIGPAAQFHQPATWMPTPGTPAASVADTVIAQLRRFLGLLIIGLALVLGYPRWLRGLTDTVAARPVASLGWGLIGMVAAIGTLIVVPLLAILLMVFFGWAGLGGLVGVTLIASMTLLGTVITGIVITVSYLVQVVVGYQVGRWLVARIQPRWAEQRVAPLVLGLALYVLARMIPGLGVVVALLVTLAGVGAIWQRGRAWLARRQARGTPAPRLTPAPQG